MSGHAKTADLNGHRPYGAMRELTPQERQQWQRATLQTPPRRYGWDARLQFWLEDLIFGRPRTLSKFKARELIARMPYLSWEQAAFLAAGTIRDRTVRARRLYDSLAETRAEQDNEDWHILILEELIAARGTRENQIRYRLIPQLAAFVQYQQFWLLEVLNPAWSCRLNADIEDHAEHEYAALVAEHPEWESEPFQSAIASGYADCESLADLFRQIGADEGVHKEMSLERMSRTRPRWPSGAKARAR